MRVYFIRHGETLYNRRHIHQPFDVSLSEKGREQALRTAILFERQSVDKLLSSDLRRARETAGIISEKLGKAVEETGLLREIRRPSSLQGKSHFHPNSFSYVIQSIWNRNKDLWHFEDGESLPEIHVRARLVREMLEAMSDQYEDVVIISHSVFLEILITFICQEGDIDMFDYFPIFSPLSKLKNASVTTLEYAGKTKKGVCPWQILSYNDVSHLNS